MPRIFDHWKSIYHWNNVAETRMLWQRKQNCREYSELYMDQMHWNVLNKYFPNFVIDLFFETLLLIYATAIFVQGHPVN